ncbi:ParB N-terminal domain-containing protein [Mycolicibacterium novocastrense]|uniref:ParB N-terminal domain-containing protein n=1 Tax=Mycolicibacterium novocastrense TaxID=59813 RepID=A0AAW5SKK8_MYCNV|nr:ParB N-terminal domain-containing protein [Mycolicibacterium novocastrense]MCV7024745.1 ParB N-terminal domain-containing protein [Mycolicibacterium novocastrense]GAT12124.1 predicted transcriptional regulator [Mycolicibacterium novocastrense]
MTDTITTADPEYGTDHHEGPDAPLGGTLEHLDPTSLVLEDNVRDEADLDKDFLDSIREHGVLTPVVAERGDDAIVRVRAGQRRTLAARAAGLATIPVYIRPATAADDRTQLTERIGQQIVENDKRRNLTDAQRARGIQQLLDAGVSVTKVAKRLAVPRDTVKAAATATSPTVAMDALDAGQLSLVEAAALTEFEDADEGTLQQLIDAAGGPQFEHTLAQLRQQRQSAKALEDAAQSYRAQGYRVLDEQPAWRDTSCVELRWLRTADGEAVTEDEITDPAHWAVWLDEEMGFVDRATGERVDEDCIDFATEDDLNAEAEEGLRHFSTVLETTVFAPEWYCIDYEGAGLQLDSFLTNTRPVVHGRDDATNGAGGEDAEARAQREAEAAEAAKRERRKVIALNKLGDAAATVRRDYVRKLLARKTPPKGAAVFVADCLARDKYLLQENRGDDTAAELLGLGKSTGIRELIKGLGATGDPRAQVITLALVLGALEARTPKDAWRHSGSWGQHVKSADYLKFLAAAGYSLAAVEEVIIGKADADAVYDRTLQDKQAPSDDDE